MLRSPHEARADDWVPFFGSTRAREHSSAPTAKSLGRRAQGLSRPGRVFRGHPKGLALIGLSTAAS